MYAVIKTGGKQYRVQVGDEIFVEKLDGENTDKLTFDEVLAVSDDTGRLYFKEKRICGAAPGRGNGLGSEKGLAGEIGSSHAPHHSRRDLLRCVHADRSRNRSRRLRHRPRVRHGRPDDEGALQRHGGSGRHHRFMHFPHGDGERFCKASPHEGRSEPHFKPHFFPHHQQVPHPAHVQRGLPGGRNVHRYPVQYPHLLPDLPSAGAEDRRGSHPFRHLRGGEPRPRHGDAAHGGGPLRGVEYLQNAF
ncbi:MAG: 50S ribosomal protein L21 [Synergistales bacterium]|nr:50S ribosomal protein L21 [Synergistales bacterium]